MPNDVFCLIDELAPLTVVIDAILTDIELGWPSLEAQDRLTTWLLAKEDFPLPHKYLLALMKALEKNITESATVASEENSDEDDGYIFSDEFLSYFLKVRSKSADEEDTGYQQFTIRSKSHKLPVLIKRSHNQVGTKVWSAGLLLAEILQYECGFDGTISLSDKSFLELGAGVGISSLIWFYSLSPALRMKELVITDYAWSVLELVDKNIEIARSLFGDCSTDHNIKSGLLDWAMLSEEDITQLSQSHCLLAADCTYSPDLNTILVKLFQTYFDAYLKTHASSQDTLLSLSYEEFTKENEQQLPVVSLLSKEIPFVLIACTLRTADTFSHFVRSLDQAAESISYMKITNRVHQSLAGKEMYYIPDRLNVEVFCIFPKLR